MLLSACVRRDSNFKPFQLRGAKRSYVFCFIHSHIMHAFQLPFKPVSCVKHQPFAAFMYLMLDNHFTPQEQQILLVTYRSHVYNLCTLPLFQSLIFASSKSLNYRDSTIYYCNVCRQSVQQATLAFNSIIQKSL